MSNTRQELLAKLRTQMIEDQPLPEVIEGNWIKFEDPISQFAEAIKFVGGVMYDVELNC